MTRLTDFNVLRGLPRLGCPNLFRQLSCLTCHVSTHATFPRNAFLRCKSHNSLYQNTLSNVWLRPPSCYLSSWGSLSSCRDPLSKRPKEIRNNEILSPEELRPTPPRERFQPP